MTETAELADLYSAIAKSAQLQETACSREVVWPILTAYQGVLDRAVVAFRVATGTRNTGDLDCRFTMLPGDLDPYAVALSHGLAEPVDHRVGTLLAELHDRGPIDSCGIDFGVVGGFKKTWSFFPPDRLQKLSELADLPSMPRAAAENADFFGRHGLDDRVSLIGIDYPHRTMNVYFGNAPAECFAPTTMTAMLRELGLPEPSDRLLALGDHAFGIYVTLNWESAAVERICFAAMTPDPTSLPVTLEPHVERFVREAPNEIDPIDRRYVYAITASAAGEYDKLQSYYRWQPRMLNVMLLSDSAGDTA